MGSGKGSLLDWIEALSFAKFAALLVAGAVGIAAIMVTAGRLTMSNRTRERWENAIGKCKDREMAGDPAAGDRASRSGSQKRIPLAPIRPGVVGRHLDGAARRWAQGFASPSARAKDAIGVCVSGGGIRSATVALGALQALREKGVLGRRGLPGVGVRRRLHGWWPPAGHDQGDRRPAGPVRLPRHQATAANAFAPGSPEEDHLRRHSSYIADGLGQWLVALGVLLRGVLSSLVIIGLTITTLGLAIGAFYSHVPITAGGNLPPPKFAVTGTNAHAPAYPAIPAASGMRSPWRPG